MRVFLTGATGFIGRPVAAALAEAGHDLLVLVRSQQTAEALEAKGYRAIVGDMTQPEDWKAEASKAQALVHAAMARPRLRASRIWARRVARADRVCLKGLIEAAREGGSCRALVETSGTAVYGDHGEDWVDEDTAPLPSIMGRCHLRGEQQVREAATRGVPACSLRPGLVYAPHGMFASAFLRPALRGSAFVIGSGRNFASPVHIDDVARAFVLAVENPPVGEALSIVDDEPVSMTELADRILAAAGGGKRRHVPAVLAALLAGKPVAEMAVMSVRCRNDRAKERLGWTPRYPTSKTGLRAVLDAFRDSSRE